MKEFLGYGRSRSSSGKGDIVKRHFNDYVNCIHTMVGGGWKTMEVLVAEFDMSEIKYIGQMSSSQNSRVIDPEGISYAVTNGHKDGEPKIIEDTPMKGNYKEPIIIDDYNQRGPQDQDVIGTVTTQFGNPAPRHGYKIAVPPRIRKLTPRECFRLMGVSESDIDKIQQSGVSQSQQYKMAGNSIVVDVLEHIFRKMFVDTGQESQQLSLF